MRKNDNITKNFLKEQNTHATIRRTNKSKKKTA